MEFMNSYQYFLGVLHKKNALSGDSPSNVCDFRRLSNFSDVFMKLLIVFLNKIFGGSLSFVHINSVTAVLTQNAYKDF
jgi:hypothetical protein